MFPCELLPGINRLRERERERESVIQEIQKSVYLSVALVLLVIMHI